MASPKTTAKVGAVVLVAFILFAGLAYFFAAAGVGFDTYNIDVLFRDAQGIKEGAEVRMAGVKIGNVNDIWLEGQRAKLRLAIRERYDIPRNSRFTVTSGGLIGDVFVRIDPKDRPAAPIRKASAGDTPEALVGDDLPTIDTMKEQVAKIAEESMVVMENLQASTARVNTLLQDPVFERALKSSAGNLEGMTAEAERAGRQINTLLAQQTPTINRAMRNVESATAGLAPITRRVDRLVAELNETLVFVNQTLEDMDAGTSLRDILGNFKTASESLTRIAANTETISKDLSEITGNPQLKEDLPETLAQIRGIAEKGNALLDRLTGIANRGARRPDLSIRSSTVLSFYQQLNHDSRFRADMELLFPRGRNFYRLGIRDLGEGNKLNLQAGTVFSPKYTMRYGFNAGKLGAGLDYGLTSGNSVSVDLYDPNNTTLDIYGRRRINDDLSIALGLEDVFQHSTPTIGLVYRK